MSFTAVLMGITSASSVGRRVHTSSTSLTENLPRPRKKLAGGRPKLTDDEVRHIRELDKVMPRQEIYDRYLVGRISYSGMSYILNYINRL